MPSIINSDSGAVSGSAGLKFTSADDGVLQIQNNGTDAVTVADDGDVTLAADLSVTGNLLFNSGFGSAGTAYGCRAWVNFNGTGTVAIRASGNVSSITDNDTGDYTANFTTAMPDADYVMVSCSTKDVGQTAPRHVLYDGGTKTTSAIRFTVEGGSSVSGVHYDNTNIYIAIFR